ncbi:MAG TPA: hypothetical protein VMT20_07160 [Terriglobia bacterium]|nr:hypothetical protein [Terriglobia bacterium]
MSDERPWEIATGTLCENCRVREATNRFGEDLSAIDWVHGNYGSPWCEVCILERQLEYARERAAEVPGLEAKLAQCRKKEKEVPRVS